MLLLSRLLRGRDVECSDKGPSGLLLPQTPEKWSHAAIVLLDVGMATHLSDTERQQMVELFRAFTKLDGATMARTALAFSGDQQGCPNPEVTRTCNHALSTA